MNQEQKALILKEIKTWRESRLLPAEYCDFLMNLYAEGDSVTTEQNETKGGGGRFTRGAGISSRIQSILLVSGFLLLFLSFAFNFTLFPMPMQIAILLVGTFFFYILAWRIGRKNPLGRVIWLAVAALFLAGDGYFYLLKTAELENRSAVLVVMSLVFLIWVVSSGLGRSRLVASLGVGGLLVLFATLLEKGMGFATSVYGVQNLVWLLPALLLLFFAYAFGKRRIYIAPVFLFFGLAAFFGPDLGMLFSATAFNFFIQAVVFLKLAVLISFLIVYRTSLKQWMEKLRLATLFG